MKAPKVTEKELKVRDAIRTLRKIEAWKVFYDELLVNAMVRQSNMVMTPVEDIGTLFGAERAKGGLLQLQSLVRFIDAIPASEPEEDDDV